jgi:hypothetical protein
MKDELAIAIYTEGRERTRVSASAFSKDEIRFAFSRELQRPEVRNQKSEIRETILGIGAVRRGSRWRESRATPVIPM